MFSLFKKKKGDATIPVWASFFSAKEYGLFVNEVDRYFKKLNIQYQIVDGVVLTEENEYGLNNLGLMNVAQMCKQATIRDYRQLVTQHFDAMVRAYGFDREFAKIADNFDEIKKYIGVRLYDNEYVAHIGKENTLGKDIAGDVYAMIIFDLPDSVKNIKPEQTINWHKTVDELFNIGVENIRRNYILNITKEVLGEFSIWFVQGEHFFTGNIIFEIEKRQELIGSKGSLIGLPNRHVAIIYPIENLEVIKAINGLMPTIYGMNQEGPGSLSSNLFWYYNKVFTQLPYTIEDQKWQFYPPESFLQLLNELK